MTDKEKLEIMKKFADGMYYAARSLTTDDSRLRKSMEDYYKFIIYEYNKKEPVSEDLERFAKEWSESDNASGCDYIGAVVAEKAIIAGAQWQKEQMMKDAIEVPVTATGTRANSKGVTTYADIEIPTKERLNPRRDKVKVIIIKE